MRTLTGTYLEEQRRAKHLTLGQLATALGYTNQAKGARRIQALEREGRTINGLLENVVRLLGADSDYVQQLVAEDRRRFATAWEHWLSEPVEPQLRFRVIPAIWWREQLPNGLSREEAIAYARARASERGFTYVLVWSRKEEVWCYPTGEAVDRIVNVGEVAGPYTWVRGRPNQGFIFG